MEFKYTTHAEEKLSERRLSKKLIEEALGNPDKIESTRFKRKIANKIINGKALRIVYEKEGNVYIIITAYYTEKARY